MKGGIPAIEGFDYQATVTLEIILNHFQSHPASAEFSPEGRDDLDVNWVENNGQKKRFHYQFKKISNPSSNNPQIWSISDVARELFPAAIRNISDSNTTQIWILGDSVAPGVRRLLISGLNSADQCRTDYLTLLHRLAKSQTDCTKKSKHKARLDQYTPEAQPASGILENIEDMLQVFSSRAVDIESAKIEEYKHAVRAFHQKLPEIISRIRALDNYGTEAEVAGRVIDKLEVDYHLNREVAHRTLFRNLRGFINDVAKEPGRTISRADFEFELASVWPQLIIIRNPPIIDSRVVRRPDLVEEVVAAVSVREVVGPSGVCCASGQVGLF